MNEEEKKAIEIIKKEITKPEKTPLEVYITDIKMLLHLISKLQKDNEKQSKVIDEMAKYIDNLEDCLSELGELEQCVVLYNTKSIKECINNHNCKECIKQYFYRKVSEENEN